MDQFLDDNTIKAILMEVNSAEETLVHKVHRTSTYEIRNSATNEHWRTGSCLFSDIPILCHTIQQYAIK
jgi:hypothetical protein